MVYAWFLSYILNVHKCSGGNAMIFLSAQQGRRERQGEKAKAGLKDRGGKEK